MSTPPDQMAKQTLADSHKVAGMAAQMHAGVLAKLAPMLAQMGQSQGASAPAGGDSEQGQDQDADEQAVWQEFPSTDPNWVGQLAGGDPQSAFQAFMQQAGQDEESLHQKQMQALAGILSGMSAPTGAPLAEQGPQNPSVGGDSGQAPY